MPHYHDAAIERLSFTAAEAMPLILREFELGRVPAWGGLIGDAEAGKGLEVVRKLFGEGEHVIAAPLALLLATCRPGSPGHTYIAGRIFQKLKSWQVAVWLFAQCAARTDEALVTYRLAQCLKSLGRRELARDMFERAYDLSRDGSSDHRLQGLIESQLRQSRPDH